MQIISESAGKIFKIKKGVFKTSKIEVVKNLDYTIKQGELIALMGMASSGKSTIINLLSGREVPSSGNIYVDEGQDLKKVSEVISGFGNKKLSENDTVYNNLSMYGNKLKLDAFDIEKKIVDLRDVLELNKAINKKISELDKIEKVKLEVAIAMLASPFVLFFDNAFLGLDTITKTILLKMLKRINKEFKTAIVIASVDLMDIEKICKRVSVVQNGKIIIDGEYEAIKDKYWKEKIVSIIFNKSFNVPKGDFEIVENTEYFLKIKVDFEKCDFATLMKQFDINSIVDINISNIPLISL